MAVELKTLLNKKTIVSTSIGTLMALSGGVWVAANEVHEVKVQVAANANHIEAFDVRSVDMRLELAKQERREIRRALRAHPADQYLLEDRDEVEDKITALEALRECVLDPEVVECGHG